MPKVTPRQIDDLLREYQLDHDGHISIEALGGNSARARFRVGKQHLRPGDTISGPTLMALADVAMYAALLGEIGLVPLAVTTSLNINFLRKPAQKDVIGEPRSYRPLDGERTPISAKPRMPRTGSPCWSRS